MSKLNRRPPSASAFDTENPTRVSKTQDLDEANNLPHAQNKQRLVAILKVKTGPESGKIIILTPGEWVAGRSNDSNIELRDSNCSRQHAKLIVTGEGRCFINDLNSTNGVFCNSQKIEGVFELKFGDEIRFSDRYVFQLEGLKLEDALKHQALYNQATQDPLTGAFNRTFFKAFFNSTLASPSDYPHVGLILFDADHFKKVNDTYSHLAGDAVLKEIVKRAKDSLRGEDIFSRIGGEEFLVLAFVDTPQKLQSLSERLLTAMNSKPLAFDNINIPFSISIGTVFLSTSKAEGFDSLYSIADAALYESKSTGRNKATHKVFSV